MIWNDITRGMELKVNEEGNIELSMDAWNEIAKRADDITGSMLKEIEILTARLRHLLQSEHIRTFDAKSDGEYVRDIKEADMLQIDATAESIRETPNIYVDNVNITVNCSGK